MRSEKVRSRKKGVVPRPHGDYEAGLTEHEAKQTGKKTVKIADAPVVYDREPGTPKSAVDTLGKPALHGHSFGVKSRGRDCEYSQVDDAKENIGAARRARDVQLGSNARLGN